MTRALAVRLDSAGDVLLMGPALRALTRDFDEVDLLVSPHGAPAARLLPGVSDVVQFNAPWSGTLPPSLGAHEITRLVQVVRHRDYQEAVIFTSYHQSPLPMALLARMAGIPRIAATSDDYPGTLLDVRHRRMPDGSDDDGGPFGGHEVTAALSLAEAAGHCLPPGDQRRLEVRRPLPPLPTGMPCGPFVVLHPSASVKSRSMTALHAGQVAQALVDDGWGLVVTGGAADIEKACAIVSPVRSGPVDVVNLAGRTSFAELASVLGAAAAVVVVNTGPAHLAAAVGTPVVSMFSPVVPAQRWGPWGVAHEVLGDQHAACSATRARDCPVPGHPCLSSVQPAAVLAGVRAVVRAASAAKERVAS